MNLSIKLIISILLAITSLTATAQSEWTTDEALLATGMVLHIVDWGQTKTIAKNPNIWKEYNPVLGSHPSVRKVNNYFLASAILVPLIAHLIPEWRREILSAWVLIELAAVSNNYHIGIKISW